MTTDFILGYIPRRMEDLGHGDHRVYMRWLRLDPTQRMDLNSYRAHTFFPFEHLRPKIAVESPVGFLEKEGSHNEQTFEHTGLIRVENLSQTPQWFCIIQAVPVGEDGPVLTLNT